MPRPTRWSTSTVWWASGQRPPLDVDARLASAKAGQTITYCFLDDDPVAVAQRLGPVLANRWERGGVEPLLAAPFYPVVAHEWDRYVP